MTRRPLLLASLALAAALVGCAGHRRADAARDVRRALAERLATQGDWERALEAADALLAEDPEDPGARLLRARALRHRGALPEAEADLQRVLEREPRSAAAHAELALVLERTSRSQDALRHHREAYRFAQRDPRLANNLAFALLARGKPAEAAPLLEAALRDAPTDARLRNNLGFTYAATGDFARAAQQFALGGAPAAARNNLGVAYERAGNLPQAFELYLEAARMAPASATARANLAHVANLLGRAIPADLPPAPPAPGTEGGIS